MRKIEIEKYNAKAIEKSFEFARSTQTSQKGRIDKNFHFHKNHFPFFGLIDVTIGDAEFVMFSSNDDLVAMTFFWYGHDSYEPMSMTIWQNEARVANCILDVGAFSGVYSLCAAMVSDTKQIFSIEAARRTYGRLLSNVQINRLSDRINCINRAASNRESYEIFQRFRGENILGIGDSFIAKDLEPLAAEERVETVSLDKFCSERSIEPNLIKIDVEGAELLVLEGMSQIFRHSKPTILIEVTPNTAVGVHEILRKENYKIWVVNESKRTLDDWDGGVPSVVNLYAKQ